MKKTLVIIILFLYLLQCGIKTMIVASFHMQREYISKTLCENRSKPKMHCKGKCYLKKQLEKAKENEQQLPGFIKDKIESPFILQMHRFTFVNPEMLSKHGQNYFRKSHFVKLDDIFHPPCVKNLS